jgi:hypothetical protein
MLEDMEAEEPLPMLMSDTGSGMGARWSEI